MASEPLNVLVVSHAAVIGVNQEPFEALASAGARVTLVAPRTLSTDLRGRLRFEVRSGSRMRAVPLAVLGGTRRAFGGTRGIHLITYLGLRKTIARVKPDVVFVEEEPHSFAARQVARTGVRFVVHENQNILRTLPFPFPRIRRTVLSRAAGVTVRNVAARDLVRAEGFVGPIGLFPHAVDTGGVPAAALDLPRPVVGFAGRLVPEKGIEDLLAATEDLDASVLVVGDGPLRAQIPRRVRCIGAVPHAQMASWYAAMDVAIVPSRTTPTWKEQFGRVIIEANAVGVPVIVSDSGELPRTLDATGGGVVVPEGDAPALRAALVSLLGDEQRRRELGETGRAAVAAKFSYAAIGAQLHTFLREVAAR